MADRLILEKSIENFSLRDYVQRDMLDDRSYMRLPQRSPGLSATLTLLILNVAGFVVQNVLYAFANFPVDRYLALSLEGLKHGYLWQLLTFQLMHGGWFHLACNCFCIYLFGREVEGALDRRSFYALYFSSGVMGGLFQALAALVAPDRFGGPMVGASAGGFGLIAAYALLFSDRELLLFFVLPLRAMYLLPMSIVAAAVGILFPETTATVRVAHAAHLGGIAGGFIFVRYAIHWHFRWPRLPSARREAPRRLVRTPAHSSFSWNSKDDIADDLPADEFLSREVDPILDKISAKGIQSLTSREKRILEAAREKMGKR